MDHLRERCNTTLTPLPQGRLNARGDLVPLQGRWNLGVAHRVPSGSLDRRLTHLLTHLVQAVKATPLATRTPRPATLAGPARTESAASVSPGGPWPAPPAPGLVTAAASRVLTPEAGAGGGARQRPPTERPNAARAGRLQCRDARGT